MKVQLARFFIYVKAACRSRGSDISPRRQHLHTNEANMTIEITEDHMGKICHHMPVIM
jgi:hypothetical protein